MCEDLFSDENYQLELNLYNIRKELIAMLEECEENLCTICLNLKCSCNKDRKIINETSSEENDADDDGWLVQGAKDVDSDVKEKEEDEEEEEDGEDEEDEADEEDEEDDEDEDEEEDEEEEDEDEEFDDVDQNDSIAPPASSLPKPKWDSPKKEGSSSSTLELLAKPTWDSPKKGGSSSSTPEKEPVHPDIGAWMEASRAEAKIMKEPIILQNLHYIDTQRKSQNIQTNGNGVDDFFKYFKISNDTPVTYMSTKLAGACSTPVGKYYTYF